MANEVTKVSLDKILELSDHVCTFGMDPNVICW